MTRARDVCDGLHLDVVFNFLSSMRITRLRIRGHVYTYICVYIKYVLCVCITPPMKLNSVFDGTYTARLLHEYWSTAVNTRNWLQNVRHADPGTHQFDPCRFQLLELSGGRYSPRVDVCKFFFLWVIFTRSKKNVILIYRYIYNSALFFYRFCIKLQYFLHSYGEKNIIVSISVSQRSVLINQYIYQYSILWDSASIVQFSRGKTRRLYFFSARLQRSD